MNQQKEGNRFSYLRESDPCNTMIPTSLKSLALVKKWEIYGMVKDKGWFTAMERRMRVLCNFSKSPKWSKSLTIKWSWFMATIGSKGKVQRLNPSHPSLHKISRYSYGLSPLARSVPVLALKRAVSRVPINFTET